MLIRAWLDRVWLDRVWLDRVWLVSVWLDRVWLVRVCVPVTDLVEPGAIARSAARANKTHFTLLRNVLTTCNSSVRALLWQHWGLWVSTQALRTQVLTTLTKNRCICDI